MNKNKWLAYGFGMLCFVMVIFCLTYSNRDIKEQSDFNQAEIKTKTEAFLLERANVLLGEESLINTESSFYCPLTNKENEQEKQLRKQIFEYGKVIGSKALGYSEPSVLIEIIKQDMNDNGKVVITAKEEVSMRHKDTSTKFGNDHMFTFMKIEGDWKLVKAEGTSENSMTQTH